LHIFSFVFPEILSSSCLLVNSRWYNLINSTSYLWTTWDRCYPFLLFHPPITTSNVKDKLMIEVMKNKRWRECRFRNRHYFEAYRGTMLLNMSLCGHLLATSTNDHLVKIWDVSCSEDSSSSNDESDFEGVKTWKIHPDTPMKVFGGHVASPKALQLSPSLLISGGLDKINIWDPTDNSLLAILPEASHCQDLCFFSATLINTHKATLQHWDLYTTSLVSEIPSPTNSDIREVKAADNMIIGMDRHQINSWDLRAPKDSCSTVVDEQGIVDCLVFDGQHTVIYNTADEVKFIDTRTNQQTQGIDVLSNLVCTTYLEGYKLILGEDPVQIRVFDIRDLSAPLFSLKTSRTPCKVRSHEQMLVSGARAWGVNVWEF